MFKRLLMVAMLVIAPLTAVQAERRIDYRHSAGNAAVGHLAVTLPRPGNS